jgi:hypothetical protein
MCLNSVRQIMKRSPVILFLLILNSISNSLFCQEINFKLEMGSGSYRMGDLKEMNDLDIKSLPFEAKVIDNFPMYWNYNASLLYDFGKWVTAGISGTFQSTGSRVSRSDYSGEYTLDTRVRALSPGAIIEVYYPVGRFRISVSNEAGIEFNRCKLKEVMKINTELQETNYPFTSKNFYYEPAVRVNYPVSFLRFGIFAGYHFDFIKKDLSGTQVNLTSIYLSDGHKAVLDWSGVRIGASLSVSFIRF